MEKTTTKKVKAVKAPKPVGLEALVYDFLGKEAGKLTLPENIFGLPWNADLVHQVVTGMQANARTQTTHTKDRGEVRGGGKKPWRQKGTGRARHGSSRSPIWKGGGVTHGPRNDKTYKVKINRQARQKALLVALSRKWKDGEVIFIDSLQLETPKTAEAKKVIAGISKNGFTYITKPKNAALFVLPEAHTATLKSFANFGNVDATDVANLNPVNVLAHKYLVIGSPAAVIETLSRKRVVKSEK